MALSTTPHHRLDRARRDFLAGAGAPPDLVAPHIRRSWERCVAGGGGLGLPAVPLTRPQLSERRDAADWLLRCAQPELDALAAHVVWQGCVAVLSDAAGLILESVGCPEFLSKARRIALEPGVEWSEPSRGTNAIGTALVERRAVMVMGPEHLLDDNVAIGCAAAPIVSARGELVGVLDISGEAVRIDAHALGLARMAAEQVEHRMMSRQPQALQGEELVHFHWRPGLLGTPREGLMSVVDGRIAGLNRVAVELLQGDWARWLGLPVEQVFGERWRSLRQAPGLFAADPQRPWAVAVDGRRRGFSAGGMAAEPTADAAGAAAPAAPSQTQVDGELARARRVLDAGLAVLVTGETGVGKDVFARRLHAASQRAGGPLVVVNCAAIPETLIEAELFGYEEGAFTGASRRGSPGRLREAHGGVLFLDEIGDMPLALQPRLLRVLEARRVRPLGGAREVEVDFALVCASHRDLAALVAEGRFREDLYYRLRGFALRLPPLRERQDRRALIGQLWQELQGPAGAAPRIGLSNAALARLDRYPWPGNVRELVATLKAALALAEPGSVLQPHDLPLPPEPGEATAMAATATATATSADAGTPAPAAAGTTPLAPQAGLALAVLTAEAVRQALARQGGNVAAAARELGVHRSTLYRQLGRRPVP